MVEIEVIPHHFPPGMVIRKHDSRQTFPSARWQYWNDRLGKWTAYGGTIYRSNEHKLVDQIVKRLVSSDGGVQ